MNCPSCHAPVADGAPECPSCGVILSKWHARPSRTKIQTPVPREPQRREWAIVIAVVVVVAVIFGGTYLLLKKIRPKAQRSSEPTSRLRAIDPSSADFDLAFKLPGRPQAAASDGNEMIIANGSDPWGALRIAQNYTPVAVPIIESRYKQKMGLNTLTWNGRNYIGYTTGSWFGKEGDVFTIHDRKTLQVIDTRPAPPLIGGLAWDGAHYWASTRKNTEDAREEAFLYKLDPAFQIIAKLTPPGIGCQGLAWDGERLWYVDVFSDSILVLDVSAGEPRVIHDARSPIDYLSGVVFHDNAIWITDYAENRLQRLRNSTRMAWAAYTSPKVIASMVPQGSALSARYRNSFVDRERDDAEEIEWAVELRKDGVWLTSSRMWFGPELFVPREQSSSITLPVFAHYTFTVKKPDGSEIEKEFSATAGDNVLTEVRLADAAGPGKYSVSLFIHVQYIDANGTGRILNNSGGFVELRN